MSFFIIALLLTILSNIFYHTTQKSIPAGANPLLTVIIAYFVALCALVLVYLFFPSNGTLKEAFKSLDWTAIVLGIAIIGVDLGYLLTYRFGGNLSYVPILVTTSVTILIIPIGLMVFKEQFTITKALGVILGIGSIILLNYKT